MPNDLDSERFTLRQTAQARDDFARHRQLKRRWYARRVGGAEARVEELLCSRIVLPPLKPSGAGKGTLGPLS